MIELLDEFRDSLNGDFSGVRAESEKFLIEGKKVEFVIYVEKGEVKYRIEIT